MNHTGTNNGKLNLVYEKWAHIPLRLLPHQFLRISKDDPYARIRTQLNANYLTTGRGGGQWNRRVGSRCASLASRGAASITGTFKGKHGKVHSDPYWLSSDWT